MLGSRRRPDRLWKLSSPFSECNRGDREADRIPLNWVIRVGHFKRGRSVKHITTITLAAMMATGLFGQALAGPLEDAAAAKTRGDYPAALGILRPAADRGDARAQYKLGELYADPGPTQDLPQAATWFHKAADQGNVRAEVMIGGMYAMGGGVSPDGAQALYWFRKAADQGDAEGQTGVGQIYARGLGVMEDDTQAFAWFRKAAEQQFMAAELNVAFDYENGRGVA